MTDIFTLIEQPDKRIQRILDTYQRIAIVYSSLVKDQTPVYGGSPINTNQTDNIKVCINTQNSNITWRG
jgi:hypothetical protein